MNTARKLMLTVVFAALVGCANQPEQKVVGTYVGPAIEMRLQDLTLTFRDGTSLPLGRVFEGFSPATGLFARRLPMDQLDMRKIHDRALRTVLPLYDANGNGFIEEPELTVFYINETALGLGRNVDRLGGETPILAIAAPAADLGGLMDYVAAQHLALAPETKAMFDEMTRIGIDLQLEADGGDRRRKSGN